MFSTTASPYWLSRLGQAKEVHIGGFIENHEFSGRLGPVIGDYGTGELVSRNHLDIKRTDDFPDRLSGFDFDLSQNRRLGFADVDHRAGLTTAGRRGKRKQRSNHQGNPQASGSHGRHVIRACSHPVGGIPTNRIGIVIPERNE